MGIPSVSEGPSCHSRVCWPGAVVVGVSTAGPTHLFSAGPPSAAGTGAAGGRGLETKLLCAHADSSWCLFAACTPCVQAAPAGRRKQAGRSQCLQPGPPQHSHPLKPARERCRYVLCRAGIPVLSETLQKPLCAESDAEKIPRRVLILTGLLPPSALLHEREGAAHPSHLSLPLGCRETLCCGQGLWTTYKSFPGH